MGKHKIKGLVIQTVPVFPPIGTHSHDWSAVLDDYDGAEDAGRQPVGWGATEEAAIAALLDAIEPEE